MQDFKNIPRQKILLNFRAKILINTIVYPVNKSRIRVEFLYIVIKKLKQPEYNENIPIYGIIRTISTKNTIIINSQHK